MTFNKLRCIHPIDNISYELGPGGAKLNARKPPERMLTLCNCVLRCTKNNLERHNIIMHAIVLHYTKLVFPPKIVRLPIPIQVINHVTMMHMHADFAVHKIIKKILPDLPVPVNYCVISPLSRIYQSYCCWKSFWDAYEHFPWHFIWRVIIPPSIAML